MSQNPEITRLSVSVPTPLLEQMRQVSRENDRSVAGEIRRALAEHVSRQQAKAA